MRGKAAASLEEQIKRLYKCKGCGRKFRFVKHRDHCPCCGGTLIIVTTVEKGSHE